MNIVEAGGMFKHVYQTNGVCLGPAILDPDFRNNVFQDGVETQNVTFLQ